MALQEVLIQILREINLEMKPEFFIDHPFLLKIQYNYCKGKFNEDGSYELASAVSTASHVFSLLTYSEKTLDYMIRRRKVTNTIHPNEQELFNMVIGFVLHFYQNVDSVLEAQHYIYHPLLLLFLETANVLQKVGHSDTGFHLELHAPSRSRD